MKSIKFDYAETGEVQIQFSGTSLGALFSIGAISETKKTVATEGAYYHDYATDNEGLKDIIFQSDQALDSLHESLSTLGYLLVYCEKEEIQNKLDSLGWLIASLSDLADQVSRRSAEFRHSLEYQDSEKNGIDNDKG